MEYAMEMGTTRRHNEILSGIQFDILTNFKALYKARKVVSLLEQVALCHIFKAFGVIIF